MSRYRPPTPPGSKYITPEGAARLRVELDHLWRDERPRVTQAVSEAAAQGDRSENADYIYGKRRLHEIDRRVRHLRQRLEGMTVVDPSADSHRRDPLRVHFGAWVHLQNDAGALRWYRIVGPDEFDLREDYVSMDSPLGRALLGRRIEDSVSIELPGKAAAYLITAVSYALTPPAHS